MLMDTCQRPSLEAPPARYQATLFVGEHTRRVLFVHALHPVKCCQQCRSHRMQGQKE